MGRQGRPGDGPSDTDYATVINNRNAAAQSGPFRTGRTDWADFDQSYDQATPNTDLPTASGYVVQDGDTLQSIATALWGDASLWWMIADANGLAAGATLAAGANLVIPNKVANSHNNADTFRPYDPNKAIGNTSPTSPKPAKKAHCGVGQIIVAIVAAVVAFYVAPWAAEHLFAAFGQFGAAVAGGALGGAAASVVSQGVGIAIGVQSKFDWKAVAMAAIGSAVTAGVGRIPGLQNIKGDIGGNFIKGVGRGVISNVVTQGVAMATGLQRRFDWLGVAVSGVVGGVSSATSTMLSGGKGFGDGSVPNLAISGLAGGIAGAATRTLIQGSDFGDNVLAVLPDVIAQTVGAAIAGALFEADAPKTGAGGDAENQGPRQPSSATAQYPQATSAADVASPAAATVCSVPGTSSNRGLDGAGAPEPNTSLADSQDGKPSDSANTVEEVVVIANKRALADSRGFWDWVLKGAGDLINLRFDRLEADYTGAKNALHHSSNTGTNGSLTSPSDIANWPSMDTAASAMEGPVVFDEISWLKTRLQADADMRISAGIYNVRGVDYIDYPGASNAAPVSYIGAPDQIALAQRNSDYQFAEQLAQAEGGVLSGVAFGVAKVFDFSDNTTNAILAGTSATEGLIFALGATYGEAPRFTGAARPDISLYEIKPTSYSSSGLWETAAEEVPHVKPDYSVIADPPNLTASTKPTPRMVQEMKRLNMEANGGVLRDDVTGEIMVPSVKSQRGVTPPSNEVQVDHIIAVDNGGTRTITNLDLRTRANNRAKWNK